MATFKGDALRAVERARAEGNLARKVVFLEDAVAELVQELEMVLSRLGPENFSELGRKAMKEE